MASFRFDPKTRKARFHFRYDRRQYNKTLRMESERHAERLQGSIEGTIEDLERGRIALPIDSDPATFIVTGGKLAKTTTIVSGTIVPGLPETQSRPPTIASIFATYSQTLTAGAKEANTVYTESIHAGHFRRVLGADRRFDSLTVNVLQRYVNTRSAEGVVRDTIHKELGTLRVVWGWAFNRQHLGSPAAWKLADLTLPKAHEKPPFQTWDQIVRRIDRGGLTADEVDELWESLWLDQAQTMECLSWVRERATRPFLYPLFAFAAYTGARRAELLRSEVGDWDFDAGLVAIRQKKSDKSKAFTRRQVRIIPELSAIMTEWFETHPGGRWAIATEDGSPIDPRISTGYFRRVVRGGKWEVLHGWHTFRHSIASNLASSGVDQRVINEMLGHNTPEMERRYRHLLPSRQEDALKMMYRARA